MTHLQNPNLLLDWFEQEHMTAEGGRVVNLHVSADGRVQPTHPEAFPGWDGRGGRVIAVTQVPDHVPAGEVARRYARTVVLPVGHPPARLLWEEIAGAQQGQIVRLPAGRTLLDDSPTGWPGVINTVLG